MLAKQIMTRDVITASPELSIKELAMLLIKNQISGVPVADKDGKIIGLVSEADIISKKGKQVQAIMSQQVFSVGEEASVEEIAQPEPAVRESLKGPLALVRGLRRQAFAIHRHEHVEGYRFLGGSMLIGGFEDEFHVVAAALRGQRVVRQPRVG